MYIFAHEHEAEFERGLDTGCCMGVWITYQSGAASCSETLRLSSYGNRQAAGASSADHP